MPACFSHVYAAKYAGLGTIGLSHNLINAQYGPRMRYVSLFTTAKFKGDPCLRATCARLANCVRGCAATGFDASSGSHCGGLRCDCLHRASQAIDGRVAISVRDLRESVPVGMDRKLYGRTQVADYITEQKALEANPSDPDYRHLVHLRTHGSRNGAGEPKP